MNLLSYLSPQDFRIRQGVLCALFLSTIRGVQAGNYFQGLAAANSRPNNSGYACRSQAEVSARLDSGAACVQGFLSPRFFCLRYAQWNSVASSAKSQGFESIRIEGTDCNALDLASAAAAANGLTVLSGIYIQVGSLSYVLDFE